MTLLATPLQNRHDIFRKRWHVICRCLRGYRSRIHERTKNCPEDEQSTDPVNMCHFDISPLTPRTVTEDAVSTPPAPVYPQNQPPLVTIEPGLWQPAFSHAIGCREHCQRAISRLIENRSDDSADSCSKVDTLVRNASR